MFGTGSVGPLATLQVLAWENSGWIDLKPACFLRHVAPVHFPWVIAHGVISSYPMCVLRAAAAIRRGSFSAGGMLAAVVPISPCRFAETSRY